MLSFKKYMLFQELGDEGNPGGGTGGEDDKGGKKDGEGGDPPAYSVEWDKALATLPEELRSSKAFEPIKSFEGLAKSFVHAQKATGNRVAIPDQHATEEDWQQFFSKVGNPEKLEDYKVNLPEGAEVNEDFLGKMKEIAHKSGILPTQMEKLLGAYVEFANGETESYKTQALNQMKEDIQGLKDLWGDKGYERSKEVANVAFKEFLPEEADRQRLIDDGLSNHPSIIKAFAAAGKLLSEDKFVKHGDGEGAGLTKDDALQKARAIQGNPDHPYRNPAHPNHKKAQEEVAALYKIAFPG